MSSTRSSSPSEASFASFSSFSSGLYVPVHKRGRSASGSSFTSTATSWRSRSPACSERSMCQEPELVVSQPEPEVVVEPSRFYTVDFLISLAPSPLSRISPETREVLRANVPQIVMNRRQRKYNEFFNGMGLKEGAGAAKKEAVKAKATGKDTSAKKPATSAEGNTKTSKGRQNTGKKATGNAKTQSTGPAKAPVNAPAPRVSPLSFSAAAKASTGGAANILAPVNGTSWRGRAIRGPSPAAGFTIRVPIAAA
ncbi:hypothetical protein PC9H_008390 [Pleurotus ostreatus]|uniref:Uncharacterized protein n=1 Tax=Pleurotus ostreatus TaxID=5322 RepID=A0A8H6ZVN8_PLEOS|nr:uncharacterized protein PC9H_008390 [Pleurotus ostreatus]KAF7426025.1 hypothetical protein PC9H_008390 [Pleurotus ostreatus]KAJ8693439.1 hypothetical protein PTI98_008434 [Pleurotus ostreatus]